MELNNILQVLDYLKAEENCKKLIIQQVWQGKVYCRCCGNTKIYTTNRGYKCASCHKKFSLTTGTILENTKLPLRYWLTAIYLTTSSKKGVSAAELSRALGITGKTSWFLLQRIRAMLTAQTDEPLEGMIQLDETFVGGKNKNRHADKKVKNCQGRAFIDKTPVLGILQQEVSVSTVRAHKLKPAQMVTEKVIISPARLKCHVIGNTRAETLQPLIRKTVKPGSTVVSDEWQGYTGLSDKYFHYIVDHGRKQYVNESGYTSNALEGGWSIFKRMIIGTYHQVSRKHLHLYCNEFVYRYNTKNEKDITRFKDAISRIDSVRLTYKKLVA